MKTGEEKFDDEIRQKLRYSEVTPPVDLFEKIVPPPPSKKRGFLWIWFAGIIILGVTIFTLHFVTDNGYTRINNRNVQDNTSNNLPVLNPSQPGSSQPTSGSINQHSAGYENSNNPSITPGNNTSNKSATTTSNKSATSTSGNRADRLDESKWKQRESGTNSAKNSSRDASYTGYRKSKDADPVNQYYDRKPGSKNDIYNYDLLYVPAPSLPYDEKPIVRQQIRVIKPDNSEFQSHEATPFSLELAVNALTFPSRINAQTKDTMTKRMIEVRESASDKISGFAADLRLLYAFKNRFNIYAGLGYANRQETFAFDFTEYYEVMQVNEYLYYILFPFQPPQPVTEIDTVTVIESKNHSIDHNLTTHSFVVSAGAGYTFPINAFVICPQIGVTADVYSSTTGNTNFNSEFVDVPPNDFYNKGVRLCLAGTVQLGYSFSEKFNLFIETGYQYSLNTMQSSDGNYTEKLNRYSYGGGIKYFFFKKQKAKSVPQGPGITKNKM